MRFTEYDIEICVDCVVYHANGDDPMVCRSCGQPDAYNDNKIGDDGETVCRYCGGSCEPLSAKIERQWPGQVTFSDDMHRDCAHPCSSCDGRGYHDEPDYPDCDACGGTGTGPCPDDCDGSYNEFSRCECDSCGSTLGGARYPYLALVPE